MKIPNLIHIDKTKEIDEFVLLDLGLNDWIGYPEVLFLKWPCDRQEILLRQEIFRAMETKEFREGLHQCYRGIIQYETQKRLLVNGKNEIEAHYRWLKLINGYLTVCEGFSRLSGYCSAMDRLVSFFISPEQRAVQEQVQSCVEPMERLLSECSKCSISFGVDSVLEKGHIAPTYMDTLQQGAGELGLELSAKSFREISLDDTLSQGFLQLYHENRSALHSWEKQCALLLDYDYFELKGQLGFVLKIWELVEQAKALAIPHTLPVVSGVKEIRIHNGYGGSLLRKNKKDIVPNHILFDQTVPLYYVTGANGGGKTEYLRMVGSNLLLFMAGCPIFAQSGCIYPFTFLSTHFPADERYDRMGRLEEETMRVNRMLDQADENSVLLLNETFSGTDNQLGLALLTQVMEAMKNKGVFGMAVTHLQGVEHQGVPLLCPEVVGEENRRTYRMVRKTQSISSYAKDIIKKYQLDKESLAKRREKSNG